MKKPTFTVLVCTYNDGKYLRRCIDAVLAQTYKDFEFLLINDGSTDDVDEIARSYKDKRLRYIKLEKNSGSLARIRNIALPYIRTTYVFCTDGDCAPSRTWVAEGVNAFTSSDIDSFEGRVIYNYEGYKPRLRDRVIQNPKGGLGQGANIAYRTSAIKRLGFRERYDGMEDRDVYLRLKQEKSVPYVPSSVVFHQQKLWTVKSYLNDVHRHIPRVRLFKTYGDKEDLLWRIAQPAFLALMFLPFLLVGPVLQGRVRTWDDLTLLPFAYVKAWYLRIIIWKTSIEERVFIV